jgi:hypothetical protein
MSSSYASICVLCINNQVFDAELSRKKITHNNRLQRYEKKMTYANFFYKKKDTCCFGGALLAMGDWLWVIGYWVLDALRAIGRFAIGYWIWDMGYGQWDMGYWIWVMGYRLLAMGDWQWDIGDWRWVIGYGLWAMGYWILDMGYGLLAIGYWLWDMGDG